MMKEFRFEPSSQMIEVQEGQNLKITIIGYRTAYRLVDKKLKQAHKKLKQAMFWGWDIVEGTLTPPVVWLHLRWLHVV